MDSASLTCLPRKVCHQVGRSHSDRAANAIKLHIFDCVARHSAAMSAQSCPQEGYYAPFDTDAPALFSPVVAFLRVPR